MLQALIHAITRRMPASWHAKLSDWYARHGVPILMHTCGLNNALAEVLFGKYTGRRAHARRMARLRKIRQKPTITVAFQVWNLGMWKSDSLYRLMAQHERFTPIIWVPGVPGLDTEQTAAMRETVLTFCRQQGYTYTTSPSWEELDAQIAPDLVFIADPYPHYINMQPAAIQHLVCYIRYCFPNTCTASETDLFWHNNALFYFQENSLIEQEHRQKMRNRGVNSRVTGHPIVDYLTGEDAPPRPAWKNPHLKKVIYAPHWAIGTSPSFFTVGTFLQTGEFMLQLAKKYAQHVQFAFKPHPWLYRELCQTPGWGKEKADAYYAAWQELPNTQLELGQYKELFRQSDAMIHDSGSFIIEYLLMNKPCMFLQQGSDFRAFNSCTHQALQCYTLARSTADIEQFLNEQVLAGSDTLKQKRSDFVRAHLLPPHGQSAAQNIISCILESSNK